MEWRTDADQVRAVLANAEGRSPTFSSEQLTEQGYELPPDEAAADLEARRSAVRKARGDSSRGLLRVVDRSPGEAPGPVEADGPLPATDAIQLPRVGTAGGAWS